MNSSKHITEVNPDDRANKEKRIHISHLDGLRGLAALYVVAYHAYEGDHLSKHGASSWLYHILGLISFGQAAVAVFIVLSGYCLMMPAIQKNADYLTGGGILDYIKRRAKRILPPYYAAGALSLLLIATIPGMDRMSSGRWSASLPAFHWDILVSHLFLIHNLNYYWLHKIDYPMWSVATEWQIYFIFPLVLLPVWRRFGIFTTVCTAIIIGIAPHWLVHGKIDGASFEFIGLFAFGMAGAVLSFSNIAKYIDLRTRIPWGIITLVLLMPIAFFAKFRGN